MAPRYSIIPADQTVIKNPHLVTAEIKPLDRSGFAIPNEELAVLFVKAMLPRAAPLFGRSS